MAEGCLADQAVLDAAALALHRRDCLVPLLDFETDRLVCPRTDAECLDAASHRQRGDAAAVVAAVEPLIRAAERERIVGGDRESLELMLASVAALGELGADVVACADVVCRLLGDSDGE